MKVISFSGQLQNGKDTAADYLVTKMPGWIRASFAAQVKKIYCDAFGVDLDFIEKWKVKSEIPPGFLKPVRQSLQFIGDGFRQIQEQVWIETCFRNNADKSVIISDGRYINELIKVRHVGGINVLVWRPGFENDDPNGSEAQIRPVIDQFKAMDFEGVVPRHWGVFRDCDVYGVEYVDYLLKNDGTMEDLYRKIDAQLVPFLEGKFNE